jgi:histidinol-phosphate aminotransferase
MVKFRKEMAGLKPYQQGKPAEVVKRELGLERIEKLASNENQFGPSPLAMKAMHDEIENVNFYPEGHPYELIEALSSKLGVAPENLVVGNGGEAMIWNASMALLDSGDEIIVSEPTFDIYRLVASYLGATTVGIPQRGDSHDVEAMIAAITEKTKIIWLCTPNNPTGNIASREQLEYILENVPDDIVVVFDEAYYEFACAWDDYPADTIKYLDGRDNLILLRTLSKVYGLAGVRVGYVITSPEIAEQISKVKFTFGVNRLAQVAAKAALGDDEYLKMVQVKNREAVDELQAYYEEKGWNYIPSYANFSWVDTGQDSKLLFELLQRRGVIVRPGYHWGWTTWIRISTGTDEQMRYFKEQMDDVLEEVLQ